MNNRRVFKFSFAGGELSPEMFGRLQDVKYQTGVAKLRNFIPLTQGPIRNRQGFKLVRETKHSDKKSRLFPFIFSVEQTVVIELNVDCFRFYHDGGILLDGNGDIYEVEIIAAMQYTEDELFDIHYVQSNDIITFVHPKHEPAILKRIGVTNWAFVNESYPIKIGAVLNMSESVEPPENIGHSYYYKVMGLDSLRNEGEPETSDPVDANFGLSDTYVNLSWDKLTAATKGYNIYRSANGPKGIFGFIHTIPQPSVGSTVTMSDYDDYIDFSITPTISDNEFKSIGNYPAAVSYFEQRKCFGGTNLSPQKIWMTNTGTEYTFNHHKSSQDDDRIEFQIAARELNSIRHIVPLSTLILLTESCEWRVRSINSDALTPKSFSVQTQSYVGSSNIQPVIINNSMIYVANRGQHLRELGYNWQSAGFVSNDVSLRSTHLFENINIVDISYMKTPDSIIWCVTNEGKLIGFTYVPEQQIGSFHHHDTQGEFESCTVVSEGNEDHLYVIVKREINGSLKRFVERMSSRFFSKKEDAYFVDCGIYHDNKTQTKGTFTFETTSNWNIDSVHTIIFTDAIFTQSFSSYDEDEIIFWTETNIKITLKIINITFANGASVRTDKEIPISVRTIAISNWAMANNEFSGLEHLENEIVSILADGAVIPKQRVTNNKIILQKPAIILSVGLPYESDVQTLPLIVQIEAFSQSRTKDINYAYVRIESSSGLWIGPDENHLVEAVQRTSESYGEPVDLKSKDVKILISPKWQTYGQVYIRQQDPLPINIISFVLDVTIGG